MQYIERIAFLSQIRYIRLGNGNIGTITNGGGLSMSVCDLLKIHGGNPANFLDLGGSALEEQVYESFVIM